MTTTRKCVLALLAGALLASGASPPLDVVPALWLGMAALAWLLDADPEWPPFASRARVALTGARRGLAFGVGANLVALRFVPAVVARFTPLPWAVGALGLLFLAMFEGLRWMVTGVACETLARARVPRPVAFAAAVYAGTFVPTMMPWTVAGGASPWPVMVQLADVVGERGVAALMALTAGLLAGALALRHAPTRRRGALALGGALALLAAQVAYGKLRMAQVDRERAEAPPVSVALVQPSIEASTRWEEERAPGILARLTSLTRLGESRGAELVVWPEAAFPYPLPHGSRRDPDAARAILQAGVHGPVLTGLLLTGALDGASYNSAVVATRDGGLTESYDKRHLLWFGETVPLADRLPWMRQVFARGLGLAAGDRSVGLRAGRVRAAVLICYEDMLPEAGREAMETSPNLLVNVTNDAWFAGSSESELHLRVAALRAVEARRDMVRAVNFGPTSWVDAAGRVRQRAASDVPGVLPVEAALLDSPLTFYARHGDGPLALLLLVLANAAVWRAAGRRP
ncbi:MAG TPA: apolipoprotein N-acyltransferase [Polyangiaceae bacterium]|jgi:apolipoprotein N-acyltransferase